MMGIDVLKFMDCCMCRAFYINVLKVLQGSFFSGLDVLKCCELLHFQRRRRFSAIIFRVLIAFSASEASPALREAR